VFTVPTNNTNITADSSAADALSRPYYVCAPPLAPEGEHYGCG